jgi:cob(I)alamin adenosyltransferase
VSIVTRTGDTGSTGLMYNRRVSKSDPRVEAYGTVDELNAALGVARSRADAATNERIVEIQRDLVTLMGELATASEDRERYVKDGFKLVTEELTGKLDAWVKEIEAAGVSFRGWATPGGTPAGAAFDMARVTCRRAERRIVALAEAGGGANPQMIVYLNRLSDLLWLLARKLEATQ